MLKKQENGVKGIGTKKTVIMAGNTRLGRPSLSAIDDEEDVPRFFNVLN
jgi:hypothetical protein